MKERSEVLEDEGIKLMVTWGGCVKFGINLEVKVDVSGLGTGFVHTMIQQSMCTCHDASTITINALHFFPITILSLSQAQ